MRLIIVGATGTIGASVAAAAIASGWDVVALGRSADKLAALEGVSRKYLFDAEDLLSLEAAFLQIRASGFYPDAAVNAFGVTARAAFLEHSLCDWDRVANVNLRAPWRAMQLEADLMTLSGRGSIINIGSVASFRANGWGESAYIASKHGLLGLTRAAAIELGPKGIRVNIVCPSVIESGLSRGLEFGGSGPDEIARKHPIGRLVTSDEVAETVLWLAGSRSSGISGSTVVVDGGLTAK